MTFSLNTIILEPLSKEKPKNAVILCHGYGGDGKDIAILASYWRAHLTKTIFLCPDAPEKCVASPTGFQWFDLMDQTPEQILSKSLVAENKLNKLIDEGAIYIGKLHTHELAIGAPTFSCVDKPASNPWDFNKTAGGSSSGSGSAVGGYLVPFALGTDSGGSIRNPSSMCGIVGLKPTYNSIEMKGVQPLAKTIDTVGPMARTGKDISLIFSVLKKTLNTVNHNFKNLKIGIIEHFYNKDFIANEEVVVSFEKTIKVFEQNGSVV